MSAIAGLRERASDEVHIQERGVALCLMVNRRTRTIRVIDFRSGPHPLKSMAIAELAHKESVDRLFTLVEKDEVSTWTRLGFLKEGTIPGFYKRSDAWLLGAVVTGMRPPTEEESGVTVTLRRPPEDDSFVERAYAIAKRLGKDWAGSPLPAVRLELLRDSEAAEAVSAALRAGCAVSGFEPFGRDVRREIVSCIAKAGSSLRSSSSEERWVMHVEYQDCFDNAFVESLTAPRSDRDAALACAAIAAVCGDLEAKGVVSCFSLTPVSETALAAALVMNGFRRTGLLRQHALRGRRREDCFLWNRRLAIPLDD